MPTRLQDAEDKPQRRTWQEADGTAYRRVYNVDPNDLDALPSEGDPLPGETAALLGPFIERGGVTFQQQPRGAKQQLVLKAKLLTARSASATETYAELPQRIVAAEGDQFVYRTLAVCSAYSGIPKIGAVLSDPDIGHVNKPLCVADPVVDQMRYPGRYLVQAAWVAPRRRSELGRV